MKISLDKIPPNSNWLRALGHHTFFCYYSMRRKQNIEDYVRYIKQWKPCFAEMERLRSERCPGDFGQEDMPKSYKPTFTKTQRFPTNKHNSLAPPPGRLG